MRAYIHAATTNPHAENLCGVLLLLLLLLLPLIVVILAC
jgi:hypothetical protein